MNDYVKSMVTEFVWLSAGECVLTAGQSSRSKEIVHSRRKSQSNQRRIGRTGWDYRSEVGEVAIYDKNASFYSTASVVGPGNYFSGNLLL